MYRITRLAHDSYDVAHYVTNDPQPTNTAKRFASLTDAIANAFGRAAKMSLMTNRPHTVEYPDGRTFVVTCEPQYGEPAAEPIAVVYATLSPIDPRD